MHDRNGKPIKVGDRVQLQGEITSTSASDEFCNVTVKITEKGQDHGPFNVQGTVVLNARQTELIEESPAAVHVEAVSEDPTGKHFG